MQSPRPAVPPCMVTVVSRDPHLLAMSMINSQPSPFGHLRRERHIESRPTLSMGKQSSPDPTDVEAADEPTDKVLAVESGPAGLQRSGSLVANTQSARDHCCRAEAWACSEMVPSGRRCWEALPFPAVPLPAGKGRQEAALKWQQEGDAHPGLDILAGARQLRIATEVECHGLFSGSQRRRYVIRGATTARDLLVATEEHHPCCFHLCGPARSCRLRLQDQEGRIVLLLSRPFRLGLGCLPCCQMEMTAFTSDNQLVGTVRQRCRIFSHHLEGYDAQGLAVMKIRGSLMTSRCSSEQEFQVISPADCVLATIWKKWPGFNEACNMDHETFGVDLVAADLSNVERACLLAAAFLLNFMFFEVS